MEAGHVATTTKKRNVWKGKTKIKVYQQAVFVGVFGAGASAGRAACEVAGRRTAATALSGFWGT